MCPAVTQSGVLRAIDRHKLAVAFVQSLDKLMRGMRLYEGEGPLVRKLLELAMGTSERMLDEGEITFRLAPFGLLYSGKKVTEDDDQLSKAIFRLFADGIRELSFLPGLDRAGLIGFVNVLRTEPKAGEDDMTTLLWKRGFTHVRHYATDSFQASGEVDESAVDTLAADGAGTFAQDEQGSHEAVLSPDDLRLLRDDDTLAWMRGCEAPTTPPASLGPLIEQVRTELTVPPDLDAIAGLAFRSEASEPSPLLMAAFDGLVANGDTAGIAGLLDAVSAAGEAGQPLRDALMTPDRLVRLAPLYQRGFDELAGAIETAIGGDAGRLVPLLNAVGEGPAANQLQSTLEANDVDLATFHARRMSSEDPDVLVAAIAALSRSDTPEAWQAISEALSATLTRVRRAALEALVGHYVPAARPALERALRDPDRDNRLLALRILEESADPPVARAILLMVQDLPKGEDDELRAAFRALSRFRNPRIVEYCAELLDEKNITRSKAIQTRQLLAVNTLREIGTEEALSQLRTHEGSWHLPKPVRDAIGTALRRRNAP